MNAEPNVVVWHILIDVFFLHLDNQLLFIHSLTFSGGFYDVKSLPGDKKNEYNSRVTKLEG